MAAKPSPGPVIDLIEGFRRSKAMFAALNVGVFDKLASKRKSAIKLAKELSLDPDALTRLLDACVALRLLAKRDGRYKNLPIANVYLRRSSPETLAGYVLYSNRALYALRGHLEDAVREGSDRWQQAFGMPGPLFDQFFRTDEAKREFIGGMHGYGLLSSPGVVRAFNLTRFRRLVDLGGATGHLPMAACRRYPNLRAAVFDLPQVIEVARAYVRAAGLAGRVELIAGDFFTDPLPEADLFSLGRILHDWSEEKNHRLLRKIHARLPKRGALLVAERILEPRKTGPLSALLQSLNMLVGTEGKERTLAEYAALLKEAGFSKVQGRKTGAPLDAILAVKG